MTTPTPTYVDPTEAREHVDALMAAGYSEAVLAAMTGYSVPTIDRLHRGVTTRIHSHTAAAVLAVPLPAAALPTGGLVDGTGTRRRVQALMRTGWPVPQISAHAGLNRKTIEAALRGTPVRQSTAEAVRETYDALWDKAPDTSNHWLAGASNRTRHIAEAAGWPPPAAWDDDELDDPDALVPTPDDHTDRNGVDLDEWAFLVRGGEDPHRAAARCGVQLAAVERRAFRLARHDVLTLMRAVRAASAKEVTAWTA